MKLTRNIAGRGFALLSLTALLLAGCAGGGGLAAAAPGAAPQGARPTVAVVEADLAFLRGMIPHHQQALEMSRLVPDRTQSQDIVLLARRVELSQEDEIALMRTLLRARGAAEEEHAGHAAHGGGSGSGHPPVHGMLSDAEMAALTAASGAEFDNLFLDLMIRHHEGALRMVADLFASGDGGQAGDVFQVASHIDADQRLEISRMRQLRAARR